jgi:predicted DNA-binding transcriptional regulator AlpA
MRGNDAERFLTVKDLKARYGVPVQTIYDWNAKGVGPKYMKLGIHCRYRLADVLAWEKSRLVEPRRGVARAS